MKCLSKDYDKETSQKQSELELLKSLMENTRLQFVKDTTTFAEKFYIETSEYNIKQNADTTLNLGKDKLGQMKGKILELIKDANKITNECLSSKELWWHLKESDVFYDYNLDHPSELIDKGIRKVLERIYPILKEYGYRYVTYNIVCSDEMKKTINKYDELFKKAKNLRTEINTLIREKKETEAKGLWDSV